MKTHIATSLCLILTGAVAVATGLPFPRIAFAVLTYATLGILCLAVLSRTSRANLIATHRKTPSPHAPEWFDILIPTILITLCLCGKDYPKALAWLVSGAIDLGFRHAAKTY